MNKRLEFFREHLIHLNNGLSSNIELRDQLYDKMKEEEVELLKLNEPLTDRLVELNEKYQKLLKELSMRHHNIQLRIKYVKSEVDRMELEMIKEEYERVLNEDN